MELSNENGEKSHKDLNSTIKAKPVRIINAIHKVNNQNKSLIKKQTKNTSSVHLSLAEFNGEH